MNHSPEHSCDVSVIVVTYNSASCVRECLQSVLDQQKVAVELIVVDNVSRDDTVALVGAFGSSVKLITNQNNVGFGRACNQAFATSNGQFVYLLNPDAELVQRDGLVKLCRSMQANPSWGLAGTRVVSPEGIEESPPAMSYPGQRRTKNNFAHLPGKIAWIIGASMFIRRTVFASLRGFDPDFFLYSEETDLCLRTRELGCEIGFVDAVTTRHIGSVSERGSDPYETWVRKHDGLHQFWKKHYETADVRRLVQLNLRRAFVRTFFTGVLAKFQQPHSAAWQKHRRYRAIKDTSAKFLSSLEQE